MARSTSGLVFWAHRGDTSFDNARDCHTNYGLRWVLYQVPISITSNSAPSFPRRRFI